MKRIDCIDYMYMAFLPIGNSYRKKIEKRMKKEKEKKEREKNNSMDSEHVGKNSREYMVEDIL